MAEYRHQRDGQAPELRLGRVSGLIALAAAGLLAGFGLINATVTKRFWHPSLPRFAEVVNEVEADPAIDLLFFGPSHMMTDIDPRGFDARAAELGRPFRSYNYAVEGLRVPERDYLLGELARIKLSRLRYVLVKPDLWLHTDVENAFSTRARFFDTPAFTRRALAVRLGANRPFWTYRLPTAGLLALGGLAHLSNAGVAAELLLPSKEALHPAAWEDHPDRRGYVPLIRPHRALPGADDTPYPVRRPEQEPKVLSDGEVQLIAELFQGIRNLGARPVVVIPPVGNANLGETQDLLATLAARFPDVPALSFDPTQGASAALYEKLAYWEDEDHLSVEGAAFFSRLLAERFTREIAAAEAQP